MLLPSPIIEILIRHEIFMYLQTIQIELPMVDRDANSREWKVIAMYFYHVAVFVLSNKQ